MNFLPCRCSYCVETSNSLTLFVDFCFKDSLLNKIEWRNSHFGFAFFDVNCAFLAVSDFAIAAMHFTVSLGSFALCGERQWDAVPLTPATL